MAKLSTQEDVKHLWTGGYARLGRLLNTEQTANLRQLYAHPEYFRTRIDMARYGFGRGEYQYFRYPLPDIVQRLRGELYTLLAPVASEWMEALRIESEFPKSLPEFLELCRDAGQTRPTPLLLRYGVGDFNCLHQDVYGKVVFPFQVIVCLNEPGRHFSGGELLLVEQRPRAQSIGQVLRLEEGEAVAITTRYRPAKGSRGYYRTNFRHGVSPILGGERYTLGIIFHDSE